MKLYLITASFGEDNTQQTWGGSQADAAAARKNFVTEGAKRKDIWTYEVDVPTGKVDLIQFLNDYQGNAEVLVATRKLTAN
jgi:hypothetical protein